MQLFLHQRVKESDEGRVHSLGSLSIPLLHKTTELILPLYIYIKCTIYMYTIYMYEHVLYIDMSYQCIIHAHTCIHVHPMYNSYDYMLLVYIKCSTAYTPVHCKV